MKPVFSVVVDGKTRKVQTYKEALEERKRITAKTYKQLYDKAVERQKDRLEKLAEKRKELAAAKLALVRVRKKIKEQLDAGNMENNFNAIDIRNRWIDLDREVKSLESKDFSSDAEKIRGELPQGAAGQVRLIPEDPNPDLH